MEEGNWLAQHFAAYSQMNPWRFCCYISLEHIAAYYLLRISIFPFIPLLTKRLPHKPTVDLLASIGIAPWLETLLLQGLPIFVASRMGAGFKVQILVSWLIFFSLHIPVKMPFAGLVGGFYFAFSYAYWRQTSWWAAFWVTALSHFLRNLSTIALVSPIHTITVGISIQLSRLFGVSSFAREYASCFRQERLLRNLCEG